MTKVLVVYYSMYGHVETLAQAIAEGAASVDGVEVTRKRVPETIPADLLRQFGGKADLSVPEADPKELGNYDAILFGTPTRFGNMAGQMRQFLDQTGKLWMEGALIGKPGSVFTSTGTGGGSETTITSFYNTLIHHGMVVVGLPYSCRELADLSERHGASPYGVSTLAGADGSREVTEKERTMARFQGKHVAEIARKLRG